MLQGLSRKDWGEDTWEENDTKRRAGFRFSSRKLAFQLHKEVQGSNIFVLLSPLRQMSKPCDNIKHYNYKQQYKVELFNDWFGQFSVQHGCLGKTTQFHYSSEIPKVKDSRLSQWTQMCDLARRGLKREYCPSFWIFLSFLECCANLSMGFSFSLPHWSILHIEDRFSERKLQESSLEFLHEDG